MAVVSLGQEAPPRTRVGAKVVSAYIVETELVGEMAKGARGAPWEQHCSGSVSPSLLPSFKFLNLLFVALGAKSVPPACGTIALPPSSVPGPLCYFSNVNPRMVCNNNNNKKSTS